MALITGQLANGPSHSNRSGQYSAVHLAESRWSKHRLHDTMKGKARISPLLPTTPLSSPAWSRWSELRFLLARMEIFFPQGMDSSNTSSTRSVKRGRSFMENNQFSQREDDDQNLNPSTSSQTQTDFTAPHSTVHGSHQNLRQKRRRLVAIGVTEASETDTENGANVISRRNSPGRVSTPHLRETTEPAAQRKTNAVMSAIPNDGTATARSEITTVTEADQNFVLDQMHLNRVAYLEGRNYQHILRCEDKIHPRNQVVLKFYPLNSVRFVREVIALRKLQHPNMVELIASPSYPRTHLLVFKYCRNGTLTSCIGKIDFDTILNYFIKISHALGYIHSQNIIHGDIKPAKILLDDMKNPRICDFDVSQLLPVGGAGQMGS
ncbi:protein kinase [Plakobranchus ocellatus]|uniref:Protein kinase n=1 Tax=Plakobranchus ocellatus TaxID=259542 RepID=A0AAV4AC01_9GAST|nr:protein kinase [Plakobranchus ocellatus]